MDPFRKLLLQEKIKTAVGFGTAIGPAVAAPVRGIGRFIRSVLIGPAAEGRSWYSSASLGARSVSPGRWSRIRAGSDALRREGKGGVKTWIAKSKDTGLAKDMYMAERRGPGGLAGQAIKHPIITAGVLGGGALLAKRRQGMAGTTNIYQQAPEAIAPAASPYVNWG